MTIDPKSYNQVWAVCARWVLPVDQPPIRDGMIVVDSSRQLILAVGERATIQSGPFKVDHVHDLGDVVLIPGLVNAHTHLEFSDCDSPLGQPGISLPDWIPLVIAQRVRQAKQNGQRAAAIQTGLTESMAAGVWALGEIATQPFDRTNYLIALPDAEQPAHKIQTTLFLEQLGRDIATLPDKKLEAHAFLSSVDETQQGETEQGDGHSNKLLAAFSPHAPYSTHPRLVEQIVELARQHTTCVAMHLAETRDEIQLLEQQTGAFVERLQQLGVWNKDSFRPAIAICDILKQLALAHRSLIIHGNYLTTADLDLIAANRERMSVVYCPRTHDFFQHEDYPLQEVIRREINLAIGTDSRASNPDLCLIRELLQIKQKHPDTDNARILRWATMGGAIALGVESDFGSLTPGKTAAISAITSNAMRDPYDWLNDDQAACVPVHDGRMTR